MSISKPIHRKLCGVLIFLGFLNISCNPDHPAESVTPNFSWIPYPNEVIFLEGEFLMDSSAGIAAADDDQRDAAAHLAHVLRLRLGWEVPIRSDGEINTPSIKFTRDPSMDPEAYSLAISPFQVLVTASTGAGYFYAVQTLLQLIPADLSEQDGEIKLPTLNIRDAPRFGWRGLNLDIARHFFGVAEIKKIIDQMAAHKMNRLHFHLTDNEAWRIEIPEYPRLHEVASVGSHSDPSAPSRYLTAEDAREITAYAKERHITIVPEIEMPAHSGAIGRAYPEFSGGNNTLNVANEEAVEAAKRILVYVAELFQSPYVHFGSDEVRNHDWNSRPDMQLRMKELGFSDQKELEGWFDREIADFVVAQGLRPIGWDESSKFGLNRQTIVQWWRGLMPETLEAALNNGHDIILSPVDYVYFDYPVHLDEAGAPWEGLHNGPNSMENLYRWNPLSGITDVLAASRILGIEAAVWTEFMSHEKRLEYMIFPRLSALAEKAWTREENLDWDGFQSRMRGQYERYGAAQVNYRIPGLTLDERRVQQPEAFEGPIPSEQ